MQLCRRLIAGAAACWLLAAAACTSAPTRTSTPAPADWTPETEPIAPAGPASPAEPSLQQIPADERGLIAAAGPRGLRFLRSDGTDVGTFAAAQIVTQPTWSRDGRRVAATLTDPSSGEARVAVIDVTTWEVVTAPARRPYFFYTWNHDGSRLAALGPSPAGGTAMDILDDTGAPTEATPLFSRSIFVAWEPGGDRLLLHAGPQLLLIDDPDSPEMPADLGSAGFGFQPPAWVPGTPDFLYVNAMGQLPPDGGPVALGGDGADGGPEALGGDGAAGVPVLLRRSADTGETTSLGPVSPFVLLAVHPDGDRAAVSLSPSERPAPGEADLAVPARSEGGPADNGPQPADADGSVQIVDLDSAERITVFDQSGFWLEWSPDGSHLLIAAIAGEGPGRARLAWHVWDGQRRYELAQFLPTAAFAQNYLPFAGQYTETPRLWSPAGTAIAFGALGSTGATGAVARLEQAGQVTALGPADVAFWSPEAADAAPSSLTGTLGGQGQHR